MEEQGKRLLIAVAIAFGLMLAWMLLFPPEPTPPEKPVEKAAPTEVAPTPEAAETPVPAPAPAPTTPAAPEKQLTIETGNIHAVFSTWGGTLVSWKLWGAGFDDPNKAGKQPVDLVPFGDRPDSRWFATSFVSKGGGAAAAQAWTGEKVSPTEVRFSREGDGLRVTKRFVVHPQHYLLETFITVERISGKGQAASLRVTMSGYQDPEADTGGGWGRMERVWKAACLEGEDVSRWSAGDLKKGAKDQVGGIRWAGFAHSYFLAATAPQPSESGGQRSCTAQANPAAPGLMKVTLGLPAVTLKAGDPAKKYHLATYMGPTFLSQLNGAKEVVGFDPGFGEAVDLGFLSVIARPILWLLTVFQRVVINWGLAIIVLTLVMKLSTLHWTNKSMRSMREMAKLKPEVEKLQAKYKGDRQRVQQEMMALYKARGVSPLSGCLPMLLQMPIWFALYRALQKAAQLYQAPFIPGWIDDLTAPDPYYILPILTIGLMFIQSKLTPRTGDATQQKILQYGMPLMVGGMSLFFPAGLTLYIFTSTGLSAVHYAYLRKRDQEEQAREGKSGGRPADKADSDDGEPRPPKSQISGPKGEAGKSAPTGTKKGPRPGSKKRSSSKKRRGPR